MAASVHLLRPSLLVLHFTHIFSFSVVQEAFDGAIVGLGIRTDVGVLVSPGWRYADPGLFVCGPFGA